jgi:hypothetical protein
MLPGSSPRQRLANALDWTSKLLDDGQTQAAAELLDREATRLLGFAINLAASSLDHAQAFSLIAGNLSARATAYRAEHPNAMRTTAEALRVQAVTTADFADLNAGITDEDRQLLQQIANDSMAQAGFVKTGATNRERLSGLAVLQSFRLLAQEFYLKKYPPTLFEDNSSIVNGPRTVLRHDPTYIARMLDLDMLVRELARRIEDQNDPHAFWAAVNVVTGSTQPTSRVSQLAMH